MTVFDPSLSDAPDTVLPKDRPGLPAGPVARLALPDKRTLVGNLVCSDGPGLGFGRLTWLERRLSPAALRGFIVADGALVAPDEDELTWQPDGIAAHYAAGDFILNEGKTVHDDVLLDRVTVRNLSGRFQTLGLVFRGEFEGRKARARYAPGRGTAFIDLSLSQRVHVAVAASRPPDRCRFRPYPELVEHDLLAPGETFPEVSELPGRSSRKVPSLVFWHDQIVLGWRFDLGLGPGESADLVLAIACDPVADEAAARAEAVLADPALALAAETQAWERYFSHEIPAFHCSDPRWVRLWLYTWFVQRSNVIRLNNRRFPWPFQVPSRHTYPHLWFWDSAFHALIARWLRDPSLAHADLRTAVLQQRPDGMIPHETYLEAGTAWGNWPDGDGQSSSITQLPILAHAVWETFRVSRDRDLLADLLPALQRYDRWLARERDRDGDGLISLTHRWEGWDTSPRWDQGLDIEPVDVNCFYYAQKLAIAQIARELGDDRLANHYFEQARQVAQAIHAKMWDQAAATFFDLQGPDETPVRVGTPAAFLTLPFGLADPAQAEALINQLVDPHRFWSTYPIPTVALDEPGFSARDYWRGPTWINLNWLVIDGLRRYGRDDLAARLLRRTLDLLTLGGRPSAREYFDPLTGEGLGAVDYGWTGLCNDLIVRHVCGVQPAEDHLPGSSDPSLLRTKASGKVSTESGVEPASLAGRWRFAPLDIGLDWYELELPGQGVHVRFDRQSGYTVIPTPASS
jgi:hypothetical protein